MKLLQELYEDVQIVTEEQDGKKTTFIIGPMVVAETKNRNGRIYPSHIIEKEIARYEAEYIKKNRSLGEISHPQTPALSYKDASHIITEFKRDGNAWIGKARVLENLPMGKLLKGLIDEKIAIGCSTRGLGSLSEDPKLGAKVVGADFRLCAVDVVSDPSAPGAWVQGLVENAEWVYDVATDSYLRQVLDESKQEIKKATKSDLTEATTKAFNRFFTLLKQKSV